MSGEVVYANWWSKALFGKAFENQFASPIPPSRFQRALMRFIEDRKFGGDYAHLQIDRPVFIVGLPRSGTSLLYDVLGAHERAAYITTTMSSSPEALCTVEWMRKKLKLNIRGERFLRDSIDVDFGSPAEPGTFWAKWIGRDYEALHWEAKSADDISPQKRDEIYRDVRKVLACFGGGDGRRFVCKFPLFQTELEIIQELFPSAHFVHIVRDGRATANSLVKLYRLMAEQHKKIDHPALKFVMPYPRIANLKRYIDEYGPDDLRTTAHIWQDSIDFVHEVQPRLKHFYEFRYEDLLVDPVRELERLFAFCGLAWPAADNLAFQREFDLIGKTHHVNQYKDYELVEEIAGRTLKRLGYL